MMRQRRVFVTLPPSVMRSKATKLENAHQDLVCAVWSRQVLVDRQSVKTVLTFKIPRFLPLMRQQLLDHALSTSNRLDQVNRCVVALVSQAGTKFHILSKNSHIEILNFYKIHLSEISFFTKFTFSKSHFSQNSHFRNIIFHKVHVS